MYELGCMEVKELPESPSTVVNTVMTYRSTYVECAVECTGDDYPVQGVACQTGDRPFFPLRIGCRPNTLLRAFWRRTNVKRLAFNTGLHVVHVDDTG